MNVDKTANDLMQEQRQVFQRGPKPEKRNEAKEWLLKYLASGEKFVTEIYEAGDAKEFSESTIDRAKRGLNILSLRDNTGKWKWKLRGDGLQKYVRE